jgi:hypothetical protein
MIGERLKIERWDGELTLTCAGKIKDEFQFGGKSIAVRLFV